MITAAAELALADLAFRRGAAQVPGWSPAERGLAAAAAAVNRPGRGAGPVVPSANKTAGGLAKSGPGEMERLLAPAPSLLG